MNTEYKHKLWSREDVACRYVPPLYLSLSCLRCRPEPTFANFWYNPCLVVSRVVLDNEREKKRTIDAMVHMNPSTKGLKPVRDVQTPVEGQLSLKKIHTSERKT
ncbi:hypothetical protein KC19_9G109000 [Ceratodon purpureus]|uniref:Uncharacterized protein n=1 Tax=Ceratodon purpureus TaxID=3225 RepID=A0A8T0GST7_CERPU|nr:hypothetical protein KC19_9G109000 [Ceratodon purpureus]